MSICFGSGMLKAEISSHHINEMINSNYQGESLFTELWEKIKDLFFSTGRYEAIDNIRKLCSPEKILTLDEAEGIFFKLKELASPTYKDRFCNSHLYGSKDNCMHIQDGDGNSIIVIAEKGNQFFYSVLDKVFICNKNNI
ncbi:hypothetical protein ACWWJF_05035 [Symbiopectobacterium sp. Eva_TO]